MYWKKIKMEIYGMTFCGIHVSHTKSGRTIFRIRQTKETRGTFKHWLEMF